MHRPLTADDLVAQAPFDRLARRVLLFDEVDSTNEVLRIRLAELPDGALACAELQTAGRGRLGRRWNSPRGASVLLSVLLLEPKVSPLLRIGAMLGALSVCETVRACCEIQPEVRWPNDVTVGGRKLAGVLAESVALPPSHPEAPGLRALILGVGINCLQQPGHFHPELAGKATSLEIESSRAVERAAFAGELVARLDSNLRTLAQTRAGPEMLMQRWRDLCADIGRRTRIQYDGVTYSGTVTDITDEADLVVQVDDGGRRRFGAAATTRLWE